jgi:hypothetical protein
LSSKSVGQPETSSTLSVTSSGKLQSGMTRLATAAFACSSGVPEVDAHDAAVRIAQSVGPSLTLTAQGSAPDAMHAVPTLQRPVAGLTENPSRHTQKAGA